MAASSLVVITGPTASGKSRLAHEVAKILDAVIINADSVQVYKDFNIGSAKPSGEELSEVPYRLLSILDPEEDFNVGKFCQLASKEIASCEAEKKLPIVCGGTGLYISGLLNGLVETPEVTEEARQQLAALEEQAEGDVNAFLHEQLDSETASGLHPSDSLRIRRALLLQLSAGLSLKSLQSRHRFQERKYRALVLVLLPSRESLYEAINLRVDRMFEAGFLEEVRELLEKYPQTAKPFGSIGYRHVTEHLNEGLSYEIMSDSLKRDTRHFAKRQYTWWRNQPKRLNWSLEGLEQYSNCDTPECLSEVIREFIGKKRCFQNDEIHCLTVG